MKINKSIPSRQKLFADPCTSFWLKEALAKSANRDILDALNDANTLQLVLQEDWNRMKLEAV